MIDLIYTSGNNTRYAQMTLDANWLVGVRSDQHVYAQFPVEFVDVKYTSPNFDRHLEVVKRLRPRYATVPDLSEKQVDRQDVGRALRQAEQLFPYCDVVLIVPKLPEQLALIPSDFALAYSVVSSYGGFDACFLDKQIQDGFAGRRVHLLGGSPHRQMDIYLHLSSFASILSADGNMAQKMSKYQKYWKNGQWVFHPRHGQGDTEVTHHCVAMSLSNIRKAWQRASTLYAA